jgi:hypothetical protein
MNQTANSGVRENKLSNNIQPSSSMTMPGNPDVKFPPQSGNAVPYSEEGKITGWTTIPQGNSIVVAIGGQINFIPINNPGIVIVQGGEITILPIQDGVLVGQGGSISFKASPGADYVFNGAYGWTQTTECT